MNEPSPPWPPAKKSKPVWVTVLIVIFAILGLCVLIVVTGIGLILYSCSRH
jgi:hypothetical protein